MKSSIGRLSATVGAVVILAGLLASGGIRPGAPKTQLISGTDFTITGAVNGLTPGVAASLVLTVQNPKSVAIFVDSLTVAVGSGSPSCPSSNLAVANFSGSLAVPPNGTASQSLPITLAATAPDGCKSVTWPLSYTGTATYTQVFSTTTALTVAPSPSVSGQMVTLTANVSTAPAVAPGPPTGTVAFSDGATTIGSVAVDVNGQAQLTTAALQPGTHSIIASYSGEANFTASASNPVSHQVTGGTACPCSIWASSTVPAVGSYPDTNAVELGVKFRSDSNGFVTGVRFYKGSANTGTHVGTLWAANGTKLATATFTGETASGWQQVNFASPVAVTAGGTYVASYHTNVGQYAVDTGYFAAGVDNAPLHALQDGVDGGNGVYAYGAGGFPANSYHSNNYWIDLVFNGSSATVVPQVTGHVPATGATNVSTGTAVTATFNESVTQASIVMSLTGPGGSLVPATLSYVDATHTATLQPSAALAPATTYTATVSDAVDSAGHHLAAPVTWTFSTASATVVPQVTGHVPATGATNVSTGTAVTATFNESVTQASIVMSLTGPGGSLVPATLSYADATHTATLQPSAALAPATTYTATVSDAVDSAGHHLAAPVAWTFSTAAGQTLCPCSIWASSTVPAVGSYPDTNAVELGVKFRSDSNGFVTGVRFYKGSANTGTHVGTLWAANGTKLATATFTGETASGWQQVNFASPVAVTAGGTYVASYHTNVGQYAVDTGYFAAGVDNAPLHALQDGVDGGNGVYAYGAGGFPANSYHSNNYWIDLVFTP